MPIGNELIADCRLPSADLNLCVKVDYLTWIALVRPPIGNWQSEIGNDLVEAPRIELGSKSQRRKTLHA